MNRFKKIIPFYICMLIIAISCDKEGEQISEVSDEVPFAATPFYPENNTECNDGIIISDIETDVLFKWGVSTNASSYLLTLTNLNEATSREIKTSSNELLIRVLRGTPYSWIVKSKINNSDKTTDSEVWKFYNAGLPEESHPPFPAEAISPKIGSSIDEGIITLHWEATDVDDDVSSYTVLLDMNILPVTKVGNSSTNSLNVTVSSGRVYYWKVLTTDVLGNESDSQVFQFKVN